MTGTEEPRQPDAPDVPGPEDWTESPNLASPESSAHEMAEYAAMLRRVQRMILIAGVCAAAVSLPFGWVLAAGVLLGALLGWINFRWLAASVNAVGERIAQVHSREHGVGVVIRGTGRIFLIALVAYVIFKCSVRGLVGFTAGLAMPVLVLMGQAAYEFIAGSRRAS
jgi:hypothetical protein